MGRGTPKGWRGKDFARRLDPSTILRLRRRMVPLPIRFADREET